MEEETIEIKVPRFLQGNFTQNLRKNSWIAMTFVFGFFLFLTLGNNLFFSSPSGSVDKNAAAQNLLDFLEDSTNSTVTLEDVSSESGLYKINVNYQGQTIPLYTTTDGKFLVQNLVPLSSNANSNSNDGGNIGADISVFLNNLSLYPSLGPKDAKTIVIEFSDFQCPFCAMASGLPSWTADYSSQYGDLIGAGQKIQNLAEQGKLRIVYVSMSFLGKESVYAAEAGLCANEQGKFFEMHDAIFAAHDSKENNGKYNKDKLEILAKKISGLDNAKFNTCLEEDKYLSAVQQIAQESSKFAQGTPTFYVNGKQISASWTAIEREIGN